MFFIHQQKVKTKKCNSFVLQGIAISHLAFCCLLISIPCFFLCFTLAIQALLGFVALSHIRNESCVIVVYVLSY